MQRSRQPKGYPQVIHRLERQAIWDRLQRFGATMREYEVAQYKRRLAVLAKLLRRHP